MTADGRISRYFFGVDYVAKDLDSALRAAALRKTGGVVQQFILLCFHYDPIRGKYGALVLEAIRFASVLTLVGLAGGIWMAQRARRRKETA
jgi:protein SCO1/2